MNLFKKEKTDTHKIYHILGIKFKFKIKKVIQYVTTKQLFEVLDKVIDITQCPKAKGKLRKLQIADTLLLKIFHNICEKHNLQYWLTDGTLLGAIRHNGFIPWDDDLDICIPYDSYDKLINILKDEFKNTNFIMYGVDKTRFGNATLRITHKNFEFLNLDIFYSHPSLLLDKDREYVKATKEHYRKIYYSKYREISQNENEQVLKSFRLELNEPFECNIKTVELDRANTLIRQISSDFRFINKNLIFPLKKHKFEDFEFYVPANSDKVLTECYENYLSFPADVNHHGSTFTEFEERDIDPIIDELKQFVEQ